MVHSGGASGGHYYAYIKYVLITDILALGLIITCDGGFKCVYKNWFLFSCNTCGKLQDA